MRKVIALVQFRDNTIYRLDVLRRSGNVMTKTTLIEYEEVNVSHPYVNRTFQSMVDGILQILKNNNMYVGYSEEFGGRFYDIFMTDLDRLTDGPQCYLCRKGDK